MNNNKAQQGNVDEHQHNTIKKHQQTPIKHKKRTLTSTNIAQQKGVDKH